VHNQIVISYDRTDHARDAIALAAAPQGPDGAAVAVSTGREVMLFVVCRGVAVPRGREVASEAEGTAAAATT
jgi:hypothetical protein